MRRNILWLTILLVSSLLATQSPALPRAGGWSPETPPARVAARDGLTILDKAYRAPMFLSLLSGTTYVVTTTADNLNNSSPIPGSLRAAIISANASPGTDTIEFNIPGAGPHRINVGAGLPVISDTLTIDGYTQPGASPNTLATGNDAVLKIEIADQTLSQGIALVIAANDCVVQGLVIHGFNHAIYIDGARTVAGASGNIVRGNFIGTTHMGTAVSGDYFNGTGNLGGGVFIDSGGFKPDNTPGTANGNTVGGASPAARNVIAGNGSFGVRISQNIGTATGNLVQGNYIGTNAAGTAALGNGSGIFLASDGNTIGGTVAGARNVISGNNYNSLTSNGISICCGAENNLVQGNYIGTDATGTLPLPNAVHGIDINGSGTNNNTVGGASPAARNVISGNTVVGVAIGSTFGNKIQGNYIGTDATGMSALGNAFNGVYVDGASGAVIGGAAAGEGNVISSNLRGGIEIASGSPVVQGNLIGTKADGAGALGNPQYGIRVAGSNTLIGGRTAGTGNVIAFNKIDSIDPGHGVIVHGGNAATIVGNSIHSNEGLGINLSRFDFVTPNDACDGDDGGANGLQNYPVLTSAASGVGGTTIQGTLNSTAGATFMLDFYANAACDATGFGEGQTYLGSVMVTTDAACDAAFTATLSATIPASQFVTATATDASGNTSEFSACVQVALANSPPDAVDDAASTNEDTPVNINVLANDAAGDCGDSLTILSVTQGAHGTVSITPDRTLRYTPNANFNGPDSFRYTIGCANSSALAAFLKTGPSSSSLSKVFQANAAAEDSDEAEVAINVSPVNDPPDAVDDAATTQENEAVTLNVLANDTDVENDAFIVTGFTQGAHGSVASNPDGTLTYTPNTNFSGADSFTYTIGDGGGGTDSATVTITVNAVSAPPDAVDDEAATDEDLPVTINARANDANGNCGAVSLDGFTQPANGSVVLFNANGTFHYSPARNFHGADSFTYTLRCAAGDTDTATVTVTVNPVNDAPRAFNDSYTTDEDVALTIAAPGLLSNDTDADGDALTAALVSGPTHGTLALNPDGAFTYTPPLNYNGTTTFTYDVSDGNGGTSRATVTINIAPVNDPPVARNDAATIVEDFSLSLDVLTNDTDAEGEALTLLSVTQPANGRASFAAAGRVSYRPNPNFNGSDTFTYTVRDASGNTATATVFVTVLPDSDAPVAVDDTYATTPGTPLTITAPGVLANDFDVDGDALTASIVDRPLRGGLSLNADGSFTYTPDAGNSGCIDSFTYRISDGFLSSRPASVTINVEPANASAAASRKTINNAAGLKATDMLASLMSNGAKALRAAGSGNLTSNPTWGATASLSAPRVFHTATLLRDGKVLVVGGTSNAVRSFFTGKAFLKSAEVYDPATRTWRRTGDLGAARGHHAATLLADGKVLVAGGVGQNGILLRTAEVYDPATGRWTQTSGNLNVARAGHTAALLTAPPSEPTTTAPPSFNGKVLVAGGVGNNLSILDSAELYDPATGTWTRARNLRTGRWAHTAIILDGSKILVAGGYGAGGSVIQNTAEIYDAAADTWTRTVGNMSAARGHHTATRLLDGKVLVAGGLGLRGILDSAEVYDPVTGAFRATRGRLHTGRWLHTATLLRDGKVLVAGGNGDNSFGLFVTNTAETYNAATDGWTRTANLTTGRHTQTATLLHNNKVLAAGGMRGGATLGAAELYDPLDARQLFSSCAGVTVTQFHGEGFHGNSRIARIENGRVPCVNAETGETAECLFETGGVSAGLMWAEAVDGQYAKTGQAITPQGEPGGEWVVAARVNSNGTVPCVAPSGRDTAGLIAEGESLAKVCVVEEVGVEWNALYAYGWFPLENYADADICTSTEIHPDGAEKTRTINSCSGAIYCYSYTGAALNDRNGAERGPDGTYYAEEGKCHFLRMNGYEVPAAKRPATRSFPAPGSVNVNTPIIWRPVAPDINIANHRFPGAP